MISTHDITIDGSSQWIVGRNVTASCNIEHINGHYLSFPVQNRTEMDTISMLHYSDHSYLPASIFTSAEISPDMSPVLALTCSVKTASLSWATVKRVIDKVHMHVCSHSSYEDIKLMEKRNQIWDKQCRTFLSRMLEGCPACMALKKPSGARNVSLSSMSRELNEVVCIKHFFPDRLDVFHIMDSKTRYSTGSIVPSLQRQEAI